MQKQSSTITPPSLEQKAFPDRYCYYFSRGKSYVSVTAIMMGGVAEEQSFIQERVCKTHVESLTYSQERRSCLRILIDMS